MEQKHKLLKESFKLWDSTYEYIVATPKELIGCHSKEEALILVAEFTKQEIDNKMFSFQEMQFYIADQIN